MEYNNQSKLFCTNCIIVLILELSLDHKKFQDHRWSTWATLRITALESEFDLLILYTIFDSYVPGCFVTFEKTFFVLECITYNTTLIGNLNFHPRFTKTVC